ncbi:putative uncharacterized protein ZNRD1-AS1 [Talpa occidentalis]|uniref:putative uncharacterized protein ZNRD1-AS1 n=1 Tax=Talpa occidentalis TaxID=50954 RepID=UPI00188FE815|nr:putative uncharacterized protein ZNRD1-AS1 [Talpa occidentalis]XP_054554431.1 putative uncharacterized protein ZNRD1-AS1 [Talpa occidentalis]
MLYVLIEAERARIKKLQKENELIAPKSRIISQNREGLGPEQSVTNVPGQSFTKESGSSRSKSRIEDSEWFMLSPQEKLAWAKASKDPRIAAGQQSPLEKKILNLGGVHTTAARQLITRKYQEEYERLSREQALSLDYWLAKAESHYNKRIVEMMREQETSSEIRKKPEGRMTRSTETQKQYFLVPEREMKHIERHINRTGHARELRNKTFRQSRCSTETTFPRIVPEEHCIQTAQRRKQISNREQMQIKDHQERMIRGRELTEQKLKEKILRKRHLEKQPPICEKREKVKEEIKEFENVTAYPLYQPCRSLIKVNILMEKSQNREREKIIIKPYQKKFLTVPPFLRSQIRKIKD